MTNTQRYHTHKYHSRNLHEYYVTGHGTFPFDMLRYDCAWPSTGEDVYLIVKSGERRFQDGETSHYKEVSVGLRSLNPPTIDRWSSFGWSVSKEKPL